MAVRNDEMIGGSFANLVMGSLNLLIPQGDVYSLEPALDMRVTPNNNGAVGEFERGGSTWILYAFSDDLTLLSTPPKTYRIAVLMKNVDYACGLLCEQVQPIARDALVIHPIPAIMNSAQLPFVALAHYGEEIRCISNAQRLSRQFPIGA